MAIFTELTQLEKIAKLLTNSCGGEIISPQKTHSWLLAAWVHAGRIERDSPGSLAGQRNGGGEEKKEKKHKQKQKQKYRVST